MKTITRLMATAIVLLAIASMALGIVEAIRFHNSAKSQELRPLEH